MHITFVKKRNPDGSSCGKCEEVERRLIRDGHLARINEIAIADLAGLPVLMIAAWLAFVPGRGA